MTASELSVDQLRRHERLGTVAIYRVCAWDDRLVEIEIVSAPGLAPGRRFRFARPTVELMTVVKSAGERDARGATDPA